MSIKSNPLAFPTPPALSPEGLTHDSGEAGMTLWDYFFAAALPAIIMQKGAGTWELARNSEGMADDIIVAASTIADLAIQNRKP